MVSRKKRPDPNTGSLFEGTTDPETFAPDEDEPRYVADVDGRMMEVLRPHSLVKHDIVRKYVDICRGVRSTWAVDYGLQSTYLDLFSGPGKACEIGGVNMRPAGPVLAFEAAANPSAGEGRQFDTFFIADLNPKLLADCESRLVERKAHVVSEPGAAELTVDKLIAQLPNGFHFAMLDPYGLKALPFTIIDKLLKVEHLDMLIHVSKTSFERNLGHNVRGRQDTFDRFFPPWKEHFRGTEADHVNVNTLFVEYRNHIETVGKKKVRGMMAVGPGQRVLYWLLLVSKHPLAGEFWDSLMASDRNRTLL